ncbi:MAG: histidine kinase [Actinomycetota bacterium]|nr:histidine kinase [Actinomycetota bacterium]
MRGAKTLAWGVAAINCAVVPGLLLLNSGAGEYKDGAFEFALGAAALVVTTGVGLLLALRVPRNPIGWLLLANGAILAISGSADIYGAYALEHPGTAGGRLAAIWSTNGWPLLFACVVAIAFVFPDGRLPSSSRRWRWAVAGGVVSFLLTLVGGLLSDFELDSPFEQVPPYDALPAGIASTMQGVGLLGMIATLVVAGIALVSRFRRAEGMQRQQLKWIAYAGALIPIAILVGTIEGVLFDADEGLATGLSFYLVVIAIPAAIGIAVLRYRLYEIDRIINATLVYGALTALLAGAFVAVTLLVGVAVGSGSTLATAVATLAVAVAFRPLRARVQMLVDRRFNRARYEGLQKVDRFLDELRVGRGEPEEVGPVIADAVSDPTLRLFYWLPRDGVHADARGRVVPELPPVPAGRTPVSRGELQLGTLVHDPKLLEGPALLDPVIVRGGLAIEIARLRVEVRRQLSEVEQSRARIVAAGYEERRRLERDLHDGAQQRLVSIGLDLRHLQHELGSGTDEARASLDSVVVSLTEAIEELRELARGVRPAALDDGLAPALRELAARAPIRTEVEAGDERFEQELEAAAYFVAREALTNAVKHAGGSHVVLRAARADGNLVLSVSDDGRGGAAPGPGSGLTGLADRVAALGGRVELRSDGAGTSLVAEFPCES